MRNIRFIIIVILSVFFVQSYAFYSNESIKVTTEQIALLVDSTRTMNIDEVVKRQHEAVDVTAQFIVPSIEQDYWFILECVNTGNESEEQYIGIDISCFEAVDLYYKDSTGWIGKKNGLAVPIDKREVYSPLPGFKVTFEPFESKQIYLHLHSKYLVPTEILNISITNFEKRNRFTGFAIWLYLGAAISILLYNLLLFIQIRDKIYLYYILYVMCLLIWVSLDSGMFLYFSSSISLYYFLSIGACLMGFFLTLFTREIFQFRSIQKWIDTSLIIISANYLLVAVLVAIDVKYYQYLGMIGMPFTLFLLFVGVSGMIRKIPLSRFYVTASGFYILGLFSYAALTLGIIPFTPLTRYGFIIGSFFELIVFSLALGYRIKVLQKEKMQYQEKVIESERTMSKTLENKVKERTEELQATTSQLEESNRAKDKLFSIISHDLRGPLGANMGLMKVFKDDYASFDEEYRNKFINTLFESTNSTYTLLENLLIWSRSQTNGMVFRPMLLSVVPLISEIVHLLKRQADVKNIAIELGESEAKMFADAEMIKIVVRNLISNAIKFTDKGGRIVVTVTENADAENSTLVAISDTGVGIATRKLEGIFTIGGDNATAGTNNESGTGLGLVLCKEIIDKHNGKIWVESEVGKGSIFYFKIANLST